MHIAFLTPEFVTEAHFHGGLANYLGRVTTALVRRGHQVEVFVFSKTSGQLDYQGVLVHRVRPHGWNVPKILLGGLAAINAGLGLLGLPAFNQTQGAVAISYFLDRALRQRAKQVHFDVVEATSYTATAWWAAHRSIAPIVVRASSYAPYWTQENSLDSRLYTRLEVAAIRRCAWRCAPSQLVADAFAKHESLHVEVIEPPFHLDNVEMDVQVADTLVNGSAYLLHYGSLGEIKGSGVLAEAILPLLEEAPNLRLVLAGKVRDDESGRRLFGLAETFPNQVRYLGVLPPAQLYPIVRAARLVVLPSLVDNLPNTCLEAMSLGRVVLATRGASFEQLIDDGRSGFLVEPGDPRALRAAIQAIGALSDAELAVIGRAAQERIDQMRPEVAIPRLEDYYRSAAAAFQG